MGGGSSKGTLSLEFQLVVSKYEAEQILNESEKKDFYLEECYDQSANAKARARRTYRPNMISNQDYENAIQYLEIAKKNIPKRLLADLQTIRIIQLMPTADDGMPHTRPDDVICFPNLNQLSSLTTINHELWHVHQRKYQSLWLTIFESLGWKPWSGEIPQRLEEYRRLNPDTIDHPNWVFQERWVPIPIFKDLTHPKVSEVDIYFYNVIDNYHTKKIPAELSFYFKDLPLIAYEHPREITAYMLSEPTKYNNCKGFQELIKQIGHISI